MGVFDATLLLTLVNIIFIDLILAGDNAIVVGMAARKLPKTIQKKAIMYGTGGAVLLRILATIVVVWLLKVPWLLAIGGVLLIFIAYKVLADEEKDEKIEAKDSLGAAIRTIIVADAAMGLDNVIAVAGASNQHMVLVVIGLMISVPIVVWGSTIFIKLLNLFPWIAYVGAAVLAYTASHMITEEKRLSSVFEDKPVLQYGFIAIVVLGVLYAGYMKKRHSREAEKKRKSHPATR